MENVLRNYMKLLKLLFLLLLFAAPAFSQGYRYDNFVVKPLAAGGLQAVSGALITVCTSAGSGTPCTPKVANIYSDEALTTPLTGTGGAGTTNSDSFGNYGFYIAPGDYVITITGTGIASSTIKVTLPCGITTGCTVATLIVSGAATLASLNNTCFADQQAGADMGIKIAACASSLPSTGGIIDATGFQGTQTWSTNIWNGVTKPVTLKLGPANVINVNVTQSPANRNIKIIGGGSANGAGALTALVVGFASGDVFAPTANAPGFELSNVSFTAGVTRTSGFVVNPAPGAHYGYIHDVYLTNQYGGFKIFAGGGVGLSAWHFQNIHWGVTSAALHCGSVFTIGSTDNTISAQDTFLEDFLEVGDVGIHDAPEFLFDGNTDTVKMSNIDMGYSASSTSTQPVFKYQNTLAGGFPPRWIRLLNSSDEAGTGAAGADIVSIDSGLNLVFEGVYAVNADHGYKISCGATCHGIKIANGVIGNNNNGGIYVTGAQLALGLSVIGNDFFGNSKAAAGTTDDINIIDGNTQWSIIGNSFGQITGTIGSANNTRNAIFLTGTTNSTNYTIWGNHTQTSKYTAGFINTVTEGSNFLIQTDEGRTVVQRGPGSSRHQFLGGAGNTNWQIAAQENVNNGFEITPSTAAGGTTFSNPAVTVVQNGSGGTLCVPGSTSGSGCLNAPATGGVTNILPSVAGVIPAVVVSGTKALNTAAVTTATCDAGAAVTATGTAATDAVDWSFNAAPTATNKYGAFLVVYAVPSLNTVTFYTCNPSATTSTPTAMTVNWSVRRP